MKENTEAVKEELVENENVTVEQPVEGDDEDALWVAPVSGSEHSMEKIEEFVVALMDVKYVTQDYSVSILPDGPVELYLYH